MTKREFYNAVIASEMTEEVKIFATEAIETMDRANATRKSQPSKSQVENEPIKAKIVEYVTACGDKGCTASEMVKPIGYTVQKISSLCRQLVEAGTMEVSEIKVPKKGKPKNYTVVK